MESEPLYMLFDKYLYRTNPTAPETQDPANPMYQGASLSVVSSNGDPIDPSNIISGSIAGNIEIKGGYLQSANFVSGSTGWKLDSNGDFEGNTGTFRGTLTANSINIPDTTTANSFHVNASGDTWWGATTFASAIASISKAGAITGSSVTITGGSITGSTINVPDATTPLFSVTSSGLVTAIGITTLNIKSYTCFETSTRFTNTGVAGGTTFGTSGLDLTTTAVATNFAMSTWFVSQDIFSGSPTFSIVLNMVSLTSGSGGGAAFFGLGEPGMNGSGTTFTSTSFCGFWFQKSGSDINMYAVQNNGNASSYTTSGILTTVADNDVVDLILKKNGSTSVDYYWRKNVGSLSTKTTLSTKVPTVASNIAQFSITNVASAFTFRMIAISAAYER